MIAKMSQSAEAALLRGRHHVCPKILQDFSHLWKTREVSSQNFVSPLKELIVEASSFDPNHLVKEVGQVGSPLSRIDARQKPKGGEYLRKNLYCGGKFLGLPIACVSVECLLGSFCQTMSTSA